MPCTSLRLPDQKRPGKFINVKFITQDFDINLSVDIYQCDNEWTPSGKPTQGTHIDDEKTYHINLRSEADKRGHFVKEQSTDPHWNPGYIEPTIEVENIE